MKSYFLSYSNIVSRGISIPHNLISLLAKLTKYPRLWLYLPPIGQEVSLEHLLEGVLMVQHPAKENRHLFSGRAQLHLHTCTQTTRAHHGTPQYNADLSVPIYMLQKHKDTHIPDLNATRCGRTAPWAPLASRQSKARIDSQGQRSTFSPATKSETQTSTRN